MRYCSLVEGNQTSTEVGSVRFDQCVDVIVVGLGTAGAITAITAAEKGLSVIGMERLNGIGGMGVYGCVWDYYYGSSGGRFEQFSRESIEMMEHGGYTPCSHEIPLNDARCINGAAKGITLERAALKAGCDLWYETIVTGVYLEENRVVGVSCFCGGKATLVCARVVVDATGDITLCRMAGFAYKAGRESDGRQMRFSKTMIFLQDGLSRGVWTMCGNRESLSIPELSKLLLKCGTMDPCLKEYYSENCREIFEGTLLGIREAPRICADETVRFDRCLMGAGTDKPLFYAFSPIDNINRDVGFASETQQIWRLVCNMRHFGLSIGIPLGALIPLGSEGILVAGKGLGVDSDLVSCVRMRKDLEKCGEAAAVVAYCAITNNTSIREVSYSQVSQLLLKTGCLNENNNIGLAAVFDCMKRTKVPPAKTIQELRRLLESDQYGCAIIEIMKDGNEIVRQSLLIWMQDSNRQLAERSAFAAAVLEMREACPLLREIAQEKPEVSEQQPAFTSKVMGAIYLLGCLGDQQAIPILQRIHSKNVNAVSLDESLQTPLQQMSSLFKSLTENALKKMGATITPSSGYMASPMRQDLELDFWNQQRKPL